MLFFENIFRGIEGLSYSLNLFKVFPFHMLKCKEILLKSSVILNSMHEENYIFSTLTLFFPMFSFDPPEYMVIWCYQNDAWRLKLSCLSACKETVQMQRYIQNPVENLRWTKKDSSQMFGWVLNTSLRWQTVKTS